MKAWFGVSFVLVMAAVFASFTVTNEQIEATPGGMRVGFGLALAAALSLGVLALVLLAGRQQ